MAAVPVIFSEALNVSPPRHMDLCPRLPYVVQKTRTLLRVKSTVVFSAPLRKYPPVFESRVVRWTEMYHSF
jgi:hypothetical protein